MLKILPDIWNFSIMIRSGKILYIKWFELRQIFAHISLVYEPSNLLHFGKNSNHISEKIIPERK